MDQRSRYRRFLAGGEVCFNRGRLEDTQRYDAKARRGTMHKRRCGGSDQCGPASAPKSSPARAGSQARHHCSGMTAFGKGSVQTIIHLVRAGGALSMTTALISRTWAIPFRPRDRSRYRGAQGEEGNISKLAAAIGSRSKRDIGGASVENASQGARAPARDGQEV